MAKVAFLGLGVMGYPMAGHLQAAGHQVTVYNRTASKAEAWVAEHGGAMATTPEKAAEGAEFVMSCVGNDDDLRMVCTGAEGAFAGMSDGATFVDHTTVSAKVTRELYEAAKGQGISLSTRRSRAVRPGLRTACCRSCAAAIRRCLMRQSRSCRSIRKSAAGLAKAVPVR